MKLMSLFVNGFMIKPIFRKEINMRKIIVHAGYVPYDIVRTSQTFAPKGIPASFIMLTPEINIVEQHC